MTMSLLTPTESYAFQTFLEHIDLNDALEVSHDWANLYSGAVGLVAPHSTHRTDGVLVESVADLPVPHAGNEQLAKAAKDLMSLDQNPLKWSDSADRDIHVPRQRPLRPMPTAQQSTQPNNAHLKQHGAYTHITSSSNRNAARLSSSPLQHAQSLNVHRSQDPSRSTVAASSSSLSSDTSPSPPSPPSKRTFDDDDDETVHSLQHNVQQPQASTSRQGLHNSIPARIPASASATGSGSGSTPSLSSSGTLSADAAQQQSTSKKSRSGSTGAAHLQPHQTGPVLGTKPALLTPSQKKANHIQSEQKRRANIRRGYDALCETVPALREAIRLEEEANTSTTQNPSEISGGPGGPVRKKKSRGRKRVAIDGLEKTDGRAGPRSENVVLGKTIDYIQDLLAGQSELLGRLDVLRSMVQASGRGALSIPQDLPPDGIPLWEREWTGGLGLLDDGNSNNSDSDDDD